jgi:hypothetical protein
MSLIKIDAQKAQQITNNSRIAELKKLLSETDYVALPDYDKDKADIIAQRQLWREEIRTLETT